VNAILGTIPQELWVQTPQNVFRTDLTTRRFEELQRLRRNAIELREICRVNYGAQISSKEKGAFGRDRYLSRKPDGMAAPKKFYEGSDMRPYAVTWDGYYVDMGPQKEMYGPRAPSLFESDKLSIRHISGDFDSFVAWVDTEHYYTDHGVIHAVPFESLAEEDYEVSAEQVENSRRYPLFYLLGILLSRPALELYAELYATGSLQGAFSHVYPDMVKGLPIPELKERPGAAVEDWFAGLDHELSKGRLSVAAVRRVFAQRDQVAATLVAAAEKRQDLEARRERRNNDFLTFMRVRGDGWRWGRGESLENPPDEDAFLVALGGDLVDISTMNAVRDEFRRGVAAAVVDTREAGALQSMIDALAATLYGSRT
jgi:hypothetical protein